jgi:hypothetical protein
MGCHVFVSVYRNMWSLEMATLLLLARRFGNGRRDVTWDDVSACRLSETCQLQVINRRGEARYYLATSLDQALLHNLLKLSLTHSPQATSPTYLSTQPTTGNTSLKRHRQHVQEIRRPQWRREGCQRSCQATL